MDLAEVTVRLPPRRVPDGAFARFYTRVPPDKRRAALFVGHGLDPTSPLIPMEELFLRIGDGTNERPYTYEPLDPTCVVVEMCKKRGDPCDLVSMVYGLRISGDGDDAFRIERGGGGALYITKIGGREYIGLLQVARAKGAHRSRASEGDPSGQMSWEIPRGHSEPGQVFAETVAEEVAEEVGGFLNQKLEVIGAVVGAVHPPSDSNNAWDSFLDQPDGSPGGAVFKRCRVPAALLEAADDGSFAFRPGVLSPKTSEKSGLAVTILAMRFFPLDSRTLAKLGVYDGFTRQAIGDHLLECLTLELDGSMPAAAT